MFVIRTVDESNSSCTDNHPHERHRLVCGRIPHVSLRDEQPRKHTEVPQAKEETERTAEEPEDAENGGVVYQPDCRKEVPETAEAKFFVLFIDSPVELQCATMDKHNAEPIADEESTEESQIERRCP